MFNSIKTFSKSLFNKIDAKLEGRKNKEISNYLKESPIKHQKKLDELYIQYQDYTIEKLESTKRWIMEVLLGLEKDQSLNIASGYYWQIATVAMTFIVTLASTTIGISNLITSIFFFKIKDVDPKTLELFSGKINEVLKGIFARNQEFAFDDTMKFMLGIIIFVLTVFLFLFNREKNRIMELKILHRHLDVIDQILSAKEPREKIAQSKIILPNTSEYIESCKELKI